MIIKFVIGAVIIFVLFVLIYLEGKLISKLDDRDREQDDKEQEEYLREWAEKKNRKKMNCLK